MNDWHERCVICEEDMFMLDVEMGKVAEMHNPDNPEEEGGAVHAECGVARGWEIS